MKKFKELKNWKRYAAVTAALLCICGGIYLNWANQQKNAVPELAETLHEEQVMGDSTLVLGDTYEEPAQAVSETDASPENDYFATVRLSRQEARDKAVTTLQETMAYEENETDISQCAENLDRIVNTALEEAQIESMVIAKGYTDCVTYISDDTVSVAVSAPADGLAETDVALISDVVTSQTGYNLADVRIIEVK